MHELSSQRLNTSGLEGSGRDAGRLVELACAGEDFQAFLDAMTARRAEFVKALARPVMDQIRFHAGRLLADTGYLDRVPPGLRPRVQRYAATLRRRRIDRSSET